MPAAKQLDVMDLLTLFGSSVWPRFAKHDRTSSILVSKAGRREAAARGTTLPYPVSARGSRISLARNSERR